jgi:biopolymer transport protein ExbB
MKMLSCVRPAAFALGIALALLALQPARAQTASAPAASSSEAPWALPDAVPESARAKPPTMPPAMIQETVVNPYGLSALWRQGDWISRGTLILLLLMSMGSWSIILTKLYASLKIGRHAKEARQALLAATTVHEAVQKLRPGSAFRYVADTGIEANTNHDGRLKQNIDRSSWVSLNLQRSLDGVQSRLQDGLSFLATVGSTAPFIGLFGTVWGIYHALTAIGIAGQASIDKVAGPVGEALIMTALGLAVAVPAVLGYNWLVRRNKLTMEAVRNFGADLHGALMGAPLGKP